MELSARSYEEGNQLVRPSDSCLTVSDYELRPAARYLLELLEYIVHQQRPPLYSAICMVILK